MAAKFRSLSSRTLDMWFDDGGSGVWEGHLKMGQETTTNTYVGHVFIITVSGDKQTEVARFRMHADQVTYVITDPAHPADPTYLQQNAREEAFTAAYLNRTGVHWRHYYGPSGPRPPPVLFMWPADKVGQVHQVTSPEGLWHCAGKAARCKGAEPVNMELEVVSVAPRAFIIPQVRCIDYSTIRLQYSIIRLFDYSTIRPLDESCLCTLPPPPHPPTHPTHCLPRRPRSFCPTTRQKAS